LNKFIIISLDLPHLTHDSLFYIYMSSDQGWMFEPRPCNEYIKGLDAFIDFVKKDILDNIRGNFCCPYKHCKNEKKYRTNNVWRSSLQENWLVEAHPLYLYLCHPLEFILLTCKMFTSSTVTSSSNYQITTTSAT
jgi:hypothetical protein